MENHNDENIQVFSSPEFSLAGMLRKDNNFPQLVADPGKSGPLLEGPCEAPFLVTSIQVTNYVVS